MVLQIAFAALVLNVPGGRDVFDALGSGFVKLLGFVAAGSGFIFGSMMDIPKNGFIFAFQVLPTIIFIAALFAMLYYFAPDVDQPFRWITPGGLIGVLLWVLASVAFNFYVSNFGSYNKTYGSIGAVIVLLLYLYISSLTILFGATLNATLVRMKEEISGKQILDAKPANEKPDILDDETVEEIRDDA